MSSGILEFQSKTSAMFLETTSWLSIALLSRTPSHTSGTHHCLSTVYLKQWLLNSLGFTSLKARTTQLTYSAYIGAISKSGSSYILSCFGKVSHMGLIEQMLLEPTSGQMGSDNFLSRIIFFILFGIYIWGNI